MHNAKKGQAGYEVLVYALYLYAVAGLLVGPIILLVPVLLLVFWLNNRLFEQRLQPVSSTSASSELGAVESSKSFLDGFFCALRASKFSILLLVIVEVILFLLQQAKIEVIDSLSYLTIKFVASTAFLALFPVAQLLQFYSGYAVFSKYKKGVMYGIIAGLIAGSIISASLILTALNASQTQYQQYQLVMLSYQLPIYASPLLHGLVFGGLGAFIARRYPLGSWKNLFRPTILAVILFSFLVIEPYGLFPLLLSYPASYGMPACSLDALSVWKWTGVVNQDEICINNALISSATREKDPLLCAKIPNDQNWNLREQCILNSAAEVAKSDTSNPATKAQKIASYCSMDLDQTGCIQSLVLKFNDIEICSQDALIPSNVGIGEAFHVRPICFASFIWNKPDSFSICNSLKQDSPARFDCISAANFQAQYCNASNITNECQVEICNKDPVKINMYHFKNCLQSIPSKAVDKAILGVVGPNTAKANMTRCDYILDSLRRDQCFVELAKETDDYGFCYEIDENATTNSCLFYNFGIATDHKLPECEGQASQAKDDCYKQAAIRLSDVSYCSFRIAAAQSRIGCYKAFNINFEALPYSNCKVKNAEQSWQTCYIWKAKDSNDISFCENIANAALKEFCYSRFEANGTSYGSLTCTDIANSTCYNELAIRTGNISICGLLEYPATYYCYAGYVFSRDNVDECSKGNTPAIRDECYHTIAQFKSNRSLCNKIANSTLRTQCGYDV